MLRFDARHPQAALSHHRAGLCLRGQVAPPTASLRLNQSSTLHGEDVRLHADQVETPLPKLNAYAPVFVSLWRIAPYRRSFVACQRIRARDHLRVSRPPNFMPLFLGYPVLVPIDHARSTQPVMRLPRWLRSAPSQIGVNTGSPAKCLVALLRKLLTEAMIASGERPATCGVNTTLRRLSKASGGCGSPS
jgi:hypothetical protein